MTWNWKGYASLFLVVLASLLGVGWAMAEDRSDPYGFGPHPCDDPVVLFEEGDPQRRYHDWASHDFCPCANDAYIAELWDIAHEDPYVSQEWAFRQAWEAVACCVKQYCQYHDECNDRAFCYWNRW